MISAKRASLAAVLAAAAIAGARALEFGVDAIAGNLQFPWEDSAPIADAAFPNDNYFWGGSAWLRSPLGDDAAIRFSVDRDPVLRNGAAALVEFERGIAKISAGPYFGFLNTESTPFSAGISATVGLQWPGVAFVSMRSDSATALSLFGADVAPQTRTDISAGFYVPHAIISGVVSAKRFNETLESGDIIADSLTRYAMEVEIFKKNVPYTLFASIGYEERSKRFEAAGAIDTLGAIVVGVETAAKIGPAFKLTTGFDTGAYVFGMDELSGRGPSSKDLFFRAGLGFSLDLAALPPRPPKVEKPAEEAPAEPAAVEAAAPEPEPVPEPEEAPSGESRFGMRIGSALGYDQFLSLPPLLLFAEIIANLRGDAWFAVDYRLAPPFYLGAEIGGGYFTFTDEDSGASFSVFNAPLHLDAGIKLGSIRFEALGGAIAYGAIETGSDPLILFGLEAGGRLSLGLIFIEGSYVFGLNPSPMVTFKSLNFRTSFPRFSVGAAFNL